MFQSQSHRYYQNETADGSTPTPLHRPNHDAASPDAQQQYFPGAYVDLEGTWGERDGGHVSPDQARQDFDLMRRELTNLSQTRTNATHRSSFALRQARTRGASDARQDHETTDLEAQATTATTEAADQSSLESESFALDEFLRDGHFEKRQDGHSAKKVGVVFKHLTVQGESATTTFVRTLPSAVIGVCCSL